MVHRLQAQPKSIPGSRRTTRFRCAATRRTRSRSTGRRRRAGVSTPRCPTIDPSTRWRHRESGAGRRGVACQLAGSTTRSTAPSVTATPARATARSTAKGFPHPARRPALPAPGRTDGYILGMIRNGRGLMPSYNRIEELDRWDVVNYVRGLQGGVRRADRTRRAPRRTGDKLPGFRRPGRRVPRRTTSRRLQHRRPPGADSRHHAGRPTPSTRRDRRDRPPAASLRGAPAHPRPQARAR